MKFLGIDLSPRSMVAGFAKRDVQLRDKAREESMDLVKDTMNYRAELAIRKKREKEDALKTDLQKGKQLMNYGLDVGQVGALASTGQLEQVLKLYQEADAAGIALPDPKAVVDLAGETPVDMPLEEYLRKIKIGTFVSETSQRDLGLKPPLKKDRFFEMTGFDPTREATQYGEQYAAQLGMTPAEVTAYAFDDLERMQPTAKVDLGQFRELGQTNIDTDIRSLSKSVGQIAAGALNLDDVYNVYGEYTPKLRRSINDRAHGLIIGEVTREIGSRLRGVDGNPPERYEDIQADLTRRLSTVDGLNEFYLRADPNAEPLVLQDIGSEARIKQPAGSFSYTDDQLSAIQTAPDVKSLAEIANEISQQSGGGPEAERIKSILRDSSIPKVEDKINAILQGDDTAQVENVADETAIAQSVTGQTQDTLMSNQEQVDMPDQEVANAVTELQKVGIDTTDVVAVRDALAQASKELYELGKQRFVGSPEEYDAMLGAELDNLAQSIVNVSGQAVA